VACVQTYSSVRVFFLAFFVAPAFFVPRLVGLPSAISNGRLKPASSCGPLKQAFGGVTSSSE
jgi:hypothetical protein